MRRADGELGIFTGATRQGKTTSVLQRIRKHRRALVWSPKETVDNYAGILSGAVKVRGLRALREAVLKLRGAPARLVYIPDTYRDFENFARLAFVWGTFAACTVVVEELSDVTKPGKAPDGWGDLLRQGLGFGITIYAVTQRPAESDKTALGNASFIRTHYLMRFEDRASIARHMGIKPEEIEKLKPLTFIERHNDGRIIRGKLPPFRR